VQVYGRYTQADYDHMLLLLELIMFQRGILHIYYWYLTVYINLMTGYVCSF